MKVWKFEVPNDGSEHIFAVPWPTKVVHVDEIDDKVYAWIEVGPKDGFADTSVTLRIFGTGKVIPDFVNDPEMDGYEWQHRGTAVVRYEVLPPLVLHVYEKVTLG